MAQQQRQFKQPLFVLMWLVFKGIIILQYTVMLQMGTLRHLNIQQSLVSLLIKPSEKNCAPLSHSIMFVEGPIIAIA